MVQVGGNRAGRNVLVGEDSGHGTVRPARLDRPLRGTTMDPTYSDPQLEEMVRSATEQARQAARAEGYAAGWSQGMRAAADAAEQRNRAGVEAFEAEKVELRRRVGTLMTTLAQACGQARQATVPQWAEVADTLAEGALRIAAAALARELESVDGALVTSVKAALQRLAQPGDAVIHLNPVEAELLAGAVPGVEVLPDPAVAAGCVLVLTPAQRLKHDLPGALAAAEEVLRS